MLSAFNGRSLLVWGVVTLIICLIVIAVAPVIPVVGPVLAAVAAVLKPFAVGAIVIGAVWWLLELVHILP